MNLPTLGALAALSLLPQVALAGGTCEQGFQQAPLVHPGPYSVRSLSNGDTITFDGQDINRYAPNGTLLQTLASLPVSVFTGLFVIDPTETFIVLGESSNGDVFRIDIATGALTLLTNLVFNYDADFGPDGMLYISAATGGFGAGNDLVRLDPATGATIFLAQVTGPSGPLEFDGFGNLYYGTISSAWPVPAGATSVLIFGAAALASADCASPATCLSDSDGIIYANGYDGASDMTFDAQTGQLYMAVNNYNSGESRIWRVQGGTPSGTGPVVDEVNSDFMGGIEILDGSSAKQLRAFQPDSDAQLVYSTGSGQRIQVTAKRSSLAISGPGTSGAGMVSLDVTDAALGGGALFVYGPTASLAASESPFPIANFAPLFSALDPATAMVFGSVLPFGATGDSVSYSFMNPGGLEGFISIQALLFNNSFSLLLGTTNSVDF